jgi:hypothetical protein
MMIREWAVLIAVVTLSSMVGSALGVALLHVCWPLLQWYGLFPSPRW